MYTRPAGTPNVYGPGMSDDPERSFVVPAMIRRFRTALEASDRSAVCWGSGQATRDFLFLDEAARRVAAVIEVPGKADELGIVGRRFVESEFSIDRMASRLAVLYQLAGQ